MKKGISKRVARIKASGKSGKEAKQLARKRASSYASKQKASVGIGAGKKGTMKRKLFKEGGSKANLASYRALDKSERKLVKKQMSSARKAGVKVSAKKAVASATKRSAATKTMGLKQQTATARNGGMSQNAIAAMIRRAAGLAGTKDGTKKIPSSFKYQGPGGSTGRNTKR